MRFEQLTTQTKLDLKLANQEGDKTTPKVSKLPLPISDSPLVIDLPDGQKIVVGKMTQGSVIEVATWRGVGRPDSRTSRLMLGMGSGNVNEDSEEEGSQNPGPARPPVSKKPQGLAGVMFTVEHFFKNFSRINWSATFKALIQSLTSKKAKKSKKSADNVQSTSADMQAVSAPSIAPSITVTPVSEDAEIEAWLNSITEKAARSSSKSKPAAKKAPAKKAAVTKKAAPKSTNKRK